MSVLRVAVLLGGQQHAAVAVRPANQRDVGLLAGLEDTKIGVDRRGRGVDPVGQRAWPVGRVGICGIGDALLVSMSASSMAGAQWMDGRFEIVVVEATACACWHDELLGAWWHRSVRCLDDGGGAEDEGNGGHDLPPFRAGGALSNGRRRQ